MTTQTSTLRIIIDSANATRQAQAFERQLNSIDNSGRRASESTDVLTGAVNKLVAQMGGLLIVSSAISKMDTYTNLNNRVKLVTDSQIQLNKAVEGTFKVAQATAQAWETVTMVYQRFADNADKLNLSQEKTISLTDTVAKSIAISGASASSAEAALMQFGQALASGVLRGEEFNSIAEQAPALLKAIASGLDVDIGKLRAMAGEGKLTGDVVVKALTKSKESVDELFGRTDFTVAQSFTQVNNALVKFVGEGGKSSGVAKGLADGLYAVSQNLELILGGGVVVGIGLITKALATKTLAVRSNITATMQSVQAEKVNAMQTERSAVAERLASQAELQRARDKLLSAEQAVVANRAVIASEIERVRLTIQQIALEKQVEAQRLRNQISDIGTARSLTRMAELQKVQALATAELTALESNLARTTVASSTAVTQARNVQTAAVGRLTAATEASNIATAQNTALQSRNALGAVGLMGAIGGPAGLAVMVAALAAGYLMFSGSVEEANTTLSDQIEIVSELSGKYRELTLEKLIVEQDAINEKQKEYQKQLDTSANGILSLAQISEYSSDAQLKQASDLINVVKGLRDGSVTTGRALIKMRESGFTDGDIKQASKYFTEFTTAREGISKTTNQLDYLAQQTGIFGTKIEDSNKKIAIQRSNVNALSGDYDSLNKQFKNSIDWLMQQDSVLSMNAKKQGEVRTAIDKYNDGTITATQLTKIFHDLLPIDPNVLKKTDDLANKTQNAKNELAKANTELVKIQGNAPKASKGFDQLAKSTSEATKQQERLNKAQTAFNKSNSDKVFDATFTNTLLKRGYSEEFITAQLETANLARKEGVALTDEMAKATTARLNLEQQNSAIIDSRNKAEQEKLKVEKEQTKELKEQGKIIKVNSLNTLIARGEGDYNSYNNGVAGDAKGRTKNLTGMTISQITKMQEGKKSTGREVFAVGKYQIVPETLKGAIEALGIKGNELFNEEMQERIFRDFLISSARPSVKKFITAQSNNVESAQLALSREFASVANPMTGRSYYSGSGGNKASISAKETEESLRATRKIYLENIALGMTQEQAWKNSFSRATSIAQVEKSNAKSSEQFAEEAYQGFVEAEEKRVELRKGTMLEVASLELEASEKQREIAEAGFSPEETRVIQGRYKAMYDSRIALAKQEYREKLETFNDFRKTEEQLLKQDFDRRKIYVQNDIELNKEAKAVAIELLELEYRKESQLMQLAKKERLFDINGQFLDETQASNERYSIEIENIKLTAQESEKAHLLMMRQLQQQTTVNEKAMQARAEWSKVQSEMSGTSEYDAISETQNQRTNASQGLFDSQMAQIDQMALDPLADEKFIAEERIRIHEEMQARLTAIELEANEARYNLNASYGEQMAGNVASMFKNILGEQSRAYAVMFAVEKGFAIAQATMSMQVSIAKALEKPFPENLPLIAMAVSQGTQIIGHLSSVSKGFANGGYTGDGGKYDVAGLVHKGEVVFSQNDVARSGGVQAVENARKTGVISTPSPVQQAVQPSVNVNPNFVIVDERANPADYLFSPDGTKAFVKFFKRNRTELGV